MSGVVPASGVPVACPPVHRLRRFRLGRLVHLAHLVIAVVALAGLLGQTMAQAAPLPLMDAASQTPVAPAVSPMPDCQEMGAMAPAADPDSTAPCQDRGDCIARMGCAAVGPTLPRPASLNAPARAMRLPIAPHVHIDRDGARPSPLPDPPKTPA
jgi:hypothetical protein